MKKRVIAAMLAGLMVVSVTACGNDSSTGSEAQAPAQEAASAESAGDSESKEAPAETAQPSGPVELTVTTTFAGEDGNAQNYKNAVKAWEEKTGNTVVDTSATADETFKMRVATDFETGSEPDVLFFFNGAASPKPARYYPSTRFVQNIRNTQPT